MPPPPPPPPPRPQAKAHLGRHGHGAPRPAPRPPGRPVGGGRGGPRDDHRGGHRRGRGPGPAPRPRVGSGRRRRHPDDAARHTELRAIQTSDPSVHRRQCGAPKQEEEKQRVARAGARDDGLACPIAARCVRCAPDDRSPAPEKRTHRKPDEQRDLAVCEEGRGGGDPLFAQLGRRGSRINLPSEISATRAPPPNVQPQRTTLSLQKGRKGKRDAGRLRPSPWPSRPCFAARRGAGRGGPLPRRGPPPRWRGPPAGTTPCATIGRRWSLAPPPWIAESAYR